MLAERFIQKQFSELPAEVQKSFGSFKNLIELGTVRQIILTSTRFLLSGEARVSQYFAIQDQTLETKREVLGLAGSLTAKRKEPFYTAIAALARESNVSLREMDVDEQGEGISGKLDRAQYLLGNMQFMESEGIELGVSSIALAQQLESEGKYILFLAQRQPKRLAALFACETPLHPRLYSVKNDLEERGIRLFLLSAEPLRITRGLVIQAGIEQWRCVDEAERWRVLEEMYHDQTHSLLVARPSEVGFLPINSLKATIASQPTEGAIWLESIGQLSDLISESQELIKRSNHRFFWSKIK